MTLFLDTIKMAFSSLWGKKTRSFLSILGIVIGILTVASLLSIALSVRNQIEGTIKGLGSNLITVVQGDISSGNISSVAGSGTLTEDDYNTIRTQVPNTQNVVMVMLVSGTAKTGSKSFPSGIIFGSSAGADKDLNLKIAKGRFPSDLDDNAKANVITIGSKAATELFGSSDPIGKLLEIRGTEFTVIGVTQEVKSSLSFGGPDLNSLMIMPIQTGWSLTGIKQVYRITLQAKDAGSVNSVKDQIKKLILANHKGEKDFSVLTQDDLLSTVNGVLNILTAMLGAIAGISLLVGGIGIMNIMLVSVSERTREIGIRKAVGATQGAILLQFLIEGIILTMVGGLIAVGIYSGIVAAIPKNSPIPLDFNWTVVLMSLAFSAVVGIIFGIVPAIGASRKDPIQSLRYE